MNHGQGFTANLVTGLLVTTASVHGMPRFDDTRLGRFDFRDWESDGRGRCGDGDAHPAVVGADAAGSLRAECWGLLGVAIRFVINYL